MHSSSIKTLIGDGDLKCTLDTMYVLTTSIIPRAMVLLVLVTYSPIVYQAEMAS